MHLTHSKSPPSKITLKPLINVDIKIKIISAEFPVSLLCNDYREKQTRISQRSRYCHKYWLTANKNARCIFTLKYFPKIHFHERRYLYKYMQITYIQFSVVITTSLSSPGDAFLWFYQRRTSQHSCATFVFYFQLFFSKCIIWSSVL